MSAQPGQDATPNKNEKEKDPRDAAAELLRASIRAIAMDANLSAEERTKKIQALYSKRRNHAKDSSKGPLDHSSQTTATLPLPGCEHYKRNCSILSICCEKMYPCRLCHDHDADHKIDRYATKEMFCRLCGERQPVSSCCRVESCSWKSTKYFCSVCRLWSDKEGTNIFHCDSCGLCRVGKREDYEHCDRCCLCLPVQQGGSMEHTCVDSSGDCVICGEDLQTATVGVVPLRCSHALHSNCMETAREQGIYRCPLCRKSFADPSNYDTARLVAQLNEWQLPEEYQNQIATIACNDCNTESEAPFHFAGHVCTRCSSFNTICLSRRPMTEEEISAAPSPNTFGYPRGAFSMETEELDEDEDEDADEDADEDESGDESGDSDVDQEDDDNEDRDQDRNNYGSSHASVEQEGTEFGDSALGETQNETD
mmetsp:Transcript_7642/g.13377  ORF Transcript_7642/g.13377 Transcript_7642/m.13377 type:complete len:425 (+) Transcript_7642:177-1451(+)